MQNVPPDAEGAGKSISPQDEQAVALIEALQSGSSGALSIAQNFNDFFTYIGREASRRREQLYIEPFRVNSKDLASFDNAVRRILTDSGLTTDVIFDCDISLENRRAVSFQSINEIDSLPDADKSHPESMAATWTYFYPITWKQFTINAPYKIQITYSINPRHDFVGAMTFAAAPQQAIMLQIQGPRMLIQSANEELDALIKTTFLPPWWRYPKRALQLMEPYLGFAIYGAAISTVSVTLANYEKWTGKPLIDDKTDAQRKKEILADREEYFSRIKEINEKQAKVLEQIRSERAIEKKFDAFAKYQLEPIKPRQFEPVDELLKGPSILPLIGYLFLAFIIAGLFHILLLQLYKRLTPPSVIAIGRLGISRMTQYRVYDWAAMLLISAGILPVIYVVGKAIYQFFRP